MHKITKILAIPILLSMVVSISGYSQVDPKSVLDTVETAEGAVVLYKNYSWEFLGDEPVMLNIDQDSTGLLSVGWVNDRIRGYGQMKPDSIRDTVLILTSETMPFVMPLTGYLIRGFMYTHKGLDIRAKMSDTVRVAFDGVVRYARYNRGGIREPCSCEAFQRTGNILCPPVENRGRGKPVGESRRPGRIGWLNRKKPGAPSSFRIQVHGYSCGSYACDLI